MLQQNSTNERALVSENPFQSFISLVDYDQETRALHAQIKTLTEEVKALRDQKSEELSRFEQFQISVKNLNKAIEVQELDIKSFDEQEKKKQQQLDDVAGDYKKYQALKREIDTLKHTQFEAEEALIALWNKFEVAKKELAEKTKKVEELTKALDESIEDKVKKIDQAQISLSDRSKDRQEIVSKVPEEWLEKYEHMSMQVNDPVVPVLNESCSACFYAIAQPEMVRLKRRAIVQCKGCFRLMYLKEAMNAEEE